MDFKNLPLARSGLNFPFLVTVAKSNIPILMSTGMSTMTEVAEALNVLRESSGEDLLVIPMQCTSSYPAPFEDLNLGVLQHFMDDSNHQLGFRIIPQVLKLRYLCAAMGAVIIEKHFTLDRHAAGRITRQV